MIADISYVSYYEKFTLSGEVKCIDEEIPFEIPNGWEWCRLGDISIFLSRGKSPKYSEKKKYPVFAQKCNLKSGGISLDTAKFLDESTLPKWGDEYKLKDNDILVNSTGTGTVGRVGIFSKEVLGDYPFIVPDSHISVVRLSSKMNSYYIYKIMNSMMIQQYIEDNLAGSTNQKELYIGVLQKNLIPLPPLKEQQRIVEKIEELTPHIEHYGKAQAELDLLNRNIKEQLKKSVLQYAIEGKLVPQDKTEGTAEILLEQIQAEKQKLYEENKLKKKDLEHSTIFKGEDNKYYEKIGKNVTEIESDYSFPNSWAITRLSSICILTDGEKKEGQNICLDAKFLRGKTEGDYLQKGRFVQKGDNIILVDGENSGEVFTIPHNGYMGSTFKKLWVNPVMDLQYVLYFIQFYKDLLRNSKKGAAIPHLNKELFYSLLIGIPPLSEQQRIVNTIQNIFRCIEKN
ncbi:restriction endonuclease subunit S [Capnocytophaga sp. CM59]|uniref:restriction endonuclease subunit S n=1 Tax=Capnocytophaga sp. CM59 TaxID=936370 RepID=UPI00027C696D|nr:restriction endonuclease subunit S [Capnocytophaga sp. CM59]EJU34666.1 type I restriction modification DNA specificity domain protein [Capnocytophaga sp. CM59]